MKKFLRQILVFFAIPCGVLVVLLFLLNYLNNKAMADYKTNTGVQTLFMGDSHIECAINTALLPGTTNLSQSSESLLFTYFKLRNILQNNSAIKKVYLGFSYHNISSYADEFVYGQYAYDVAARYFFILPTEQKAEIVKHNLDELPRFAGKLIVNGFNTVIQEKESYSFLGGYKNEYKNMVASKKSMDYRISQQYYDNGMQRNFSDISIKYFNKIIVLCKEKNIELILLKTPLHNYYQSKIPIDFIKKYDSLITRDKLKLIDLGSLVLNDRCYLPNGDHVSARGALLTTNIFK